MNVRVLITSLSLWPRSGSVMYVRDLALELKRQGHDPQVFSSRHGDVANELRDAGIPVESTLLRFSQPPDIIQGHHYVPTLVAARHWATVPVISVCHNHVGADDRTPFHPAIRRYYGVSRVCVARQLREGVPVNRAALLPNFVDTLRFAPRGPLPARPRRALLFSNYAHADTQLPAVAAACDRTGLQLDVIGISAGNPVGAPERELPKYDVVFAKAKAAMEAMAVGPAVILCDYAGVGPLVTTRNFDNLRPLNFGYEALRFPLRAEHLMQQIARYDSDDAALVRDRVRSTAALDRFVVALVDIYRQVIEDYSRSTHDGRVAPNVSSIGDLLFLRAYWGWQRLPRSAKNFLQGVGVTAHVRALARRTLDSSGRIDAHGLSHRVGSRS